MQLALRLLSVFLFTISLVSSQFFGGFHSLGGFGSGLDAVQSTRDPRQNQGPVVFPPAPPDNGETSGVVPGASGYGFVPPQSHNGGVRQF